MRYNLLILKLLFTILFMACTSKEKVDLIIHDATIYTVDSGFSQVSAFAVKDGRFVATGPDEEILERYEADEILDMQGKFIYPGLIDAHCHFYWFGINLSELDLVGTKSWDDVVQRVKQYGDENSQGWILGRGWDQNDWPVKEFPENRKLDSLFPDRPVFIRRIDGHAAIANTHALKLAGIDSTTSVDGGEIGMRDGLLTGILVDNAMELVQAVVPRASAQRNIEALTSAEERCFEVGLTSVGDAGLDKAKIDLIDSLQKNSKLRMRIYAMLTPDEQNIEHYYKNGPYKTERLNVRSFKFYADGALGSYGAALLEGYADQPGKNGFLLQDPGYYVKFAQEMKELGFQMNTHAIGDRANKLILDIYGDALGEGNDRRWRIEHCQVISVEDFPKFGKFNIIPSVQPTHATSDMYWAADRLGNERVEYAYAWQDLQKSAGLVAGGSDFPIEDINPLFGFYAAVARKDKDGFPPEGFQPGNALTREQALRAMTIWAAYAAFEETEKGSIETGKFADFVVFEEDLMTAPEDSLWQLQVSQTWLGGEQVFIRK
ncbi:MAG: amidohydrolase [Bacteroidia bacterium]